MIRAVFIGVLIAVISFGLLQLYNALFKNESKRENRTTKTDKGNKG